MKEIWKDIQNYKNLYQISNLGRIRSSRKRVQGGFIITAKWKILKLLKLKIKYKKLHSKKFRSTIHLYDNNSKDKIKIVSRLVAQAFLPNELNKPEVNHIDGNRTNNSFKNLEWVTHRENIEHAKRNGLFMKWEKHYNTKLTWEKVNKIRKIYKPTIITMPFLAKKFHTSINNIKDILYFKTWRLS